MIKPTIGRVVWYRPQGDERTMLAVMQEEPLADFVVGVPSDKLVNLTVFDANGNIHIRRSVVLRQEEDKAPLGSYCEWMPYQVGQAKRDEPSKLGTPAK